MNCMRPDNFWFRFYKLQAELQIIFQRQQRQPECQQEALASFEPKSDYCTQVSNKCENLLTASKCNVLQECVNNEWSQPKVTDSHCEKCMSKMKIISEKMKKSSGEEEMKNVLQEGCETIKDQELKQQCHKFVDSDWHVAVDFIKEDVVCT
ncbi:prosaposin-like [Rhincodon typus]|uniref:prosaposin-like n=1 Tax=Rhincodon typus TaxID=259920 RepID=UPI00202FEB6D|nr:prosaposin-like [Rhincodon typus]